MLIMYLKHIFGITLVDIVQINKKKKVFVSFDNQLINTKYLINIHNKQLSVGHNILSGTNAQRCEPQTP